MIKRILALAFALTTCCGIAVEAAENNAVSTQSLPSGYIPCSVGDFSATWVEADGHNNVAISFTAPTEMMSERNYTTTELAAPITRIDVRRSVSNQYEYSTIYTFDAPAAGDTLSWVDENIAYGCYDYMVQVYVDRATDWSSAHTVIVGQLAAEIEDDAFTATVDSVDTAKVVLEAILPTTSSLGEPLTMPITKVEFGEMGTMSYDPKVIHTINAQETLVPGAKVQYVIAKAAKGQHTYTVKVYTATGGTWPATASVYIGTDQPGMAQNIQAETTAEGILVTWEAPVRGQNGGNQGDPADFTYTVSRGIDMYDAKAVVLARDIHELCVLDTTTFAEESKFVYLVLVKSPYGEGYVASSDEFVVGPAAELPYEENFDVPADNWGNTTTQHSTWCKGYSGWFCAWQIGQETYVNNQMVKPHSGKGLLYAYYNGWGETHQWDSYTSGNIVFTNATAPQLTFWLYDVAQEGSDVTLNIQTSADGKEFTTVQSIVMGNATENGWREVTVKLDDLKGVARGKIRFLSEADGSNCFAVAIDDILISDGRSSNLSSIQAIPHAGKSYNMMGQRNLPTHPSRGFIIQGNKKYWIK